MIHLSIAHCAALAVMAALAVFAGPSAVQAATQSVDLTDAAKPTTRPLPFGADASPAGQTLAVDSNSLRLDGTPWLATMGEIHYSRYPRGQWRDALLRMRSGGIDVVATYVFWNHHEEIDDDFDWSDQRDLRAFVELCKELDFPLVIRIGPWCHGEVRWGGFPLWLLERDIPLRENDPQYLAEVDEWYGAVAGQVEGKLWKDGGPIVGVQIENEYGGKPEHLLKLKEMAIAHGLDVPMYTKTAWPGMKGEMPYGAFLPLHSGYADGFWHRGGDLNDEPWPVAARYWNQFTFGPSSGNTTVATEYLGQRDEEDRNADYPFFACEMGLGMMPSYHRRVLIDPYDGYAVTACKLGSGNNLPGYYMYHGGVNPEGKLSYLNEQQDTRYTNYNDLPVKTYDFQAALGEAGNTRPQYHLARRLHTLCQDFGRELAMMPAYYPAKYPKGEDDTETLRYGVRTDGRSGYLFVNNFQRKQPMPAKPDVRFDLKLKGGGSLSVPSKPFTVPADETFIWPFNLSLGNGATLQYATAQPLARLARDGKTYLFFMAVPGIEPEFAVELEDGASVASGEAEKQDGTSMFRPQPSRNAAFTLKTADGDEIGVVVLSDEDAMKLYRGKVAGQGYVVLSDAIPLFDGDKLRLQKDVTAEEAGGGGATTFSASVWPAMNGTGGGEQNGVFTRYSAKTTVSEPIPSVSFKKVTDAGEPREIRMGSAKVAEMPHDADFDAAAVYEVSIENRDAIDPSRHLMLDIQYTGDVARVYSGQRFLTDNFYNGLPIHLDLLRYASDVYKDGVSVMILPLRKDSPVAIDPRVLPDFVRKDAVEGIDAVTVLERREAVLNP